MKVVFTQNIKNVAKKGDIKNVADGYYHNYLIPNKLAVMATPAKLADVADKMKKAVISKERLVAEVKDVVSKLNNLNIVLKGKTNGGKLYGSFAEKDLIDEIEKKVNVRLGKENFKLNGGIKDIGHYDIVVYLAEGFKATILLDVKSE